MMNDNLTLTLVILNAAAVLVGALALLSLVLTP